MEINKQALAIVAEIVSFSSRRRSRRRICSRGSSTTGNTNIVVREAALVAIR